MKDQILAALGKVTAEGLAGDIVSLGMVSEIVVSDGKVIFSITIPDSFEGDIAPIRTEAERVVAALDGVTSVLVALTADRAGQFDPTQQPPKLTRKKNRDVGPDNRPAPGSMSAGEMS